MSAFSVCLWPDHHRFSALDFMYSIPLEIRLLILTYAREPVRAEWKTITLWLVFRGDLAGQWEFVPPAIKEEQAWLLKEFEVKFKKSTKTHYPCLNYREEQAKKSKNMNSYSEFPNTGICVTFFRFSGRIKCCIWGMGFRFCKYFPSAILGNEIVGILLCGACSAKAL